MAHQAFKPRRTNRNSPPSKHAPTRVSARHRSLAAPAWLRLLWLASPALPVGGFSYSEGLESAVDAGAVTDEASAARWLGDQMALAQQRSDWPLMAAAARAWQRGDLPHLQRLNHWCLHTRETSEMRQQTRQMGRSLADWLQQRHPGDARPGALARLLPAPTWPLAWGLAAAASGAPVREALLAHGFGWAENMVQAAIKAVPLGQNAGQRLLQTLAVVMPAAVDDALDQSARGATAWQNFSPMLAVLSARHEGQYSRLFRS